MLEKADFQISDLELKDNTIVVDDRLLEKLAEQGAPVAVMDELKRKKQIKAKKLFFLHATTNGVCSISADEEAQGTLRYFGLGRGLQELVSASHFVAIDELEASSHPDLVIFFLQMSRAVRSSKP